MKDRDRIIHHSSFRRLKHKTQVFLSSSNDNYRTRLTHTLEVSQIARTLARLLSLNEDLTEAIALGHDVGHTPFGHAGEKVLQECAFPNFKHSDQSVRVLDVISNHSRGINLTKEVLDGIQKHSKTGKRKIFPEKTDLPLTQEAEIVRISDIIAYVNHDLDDAVRSGILDLEDIPQSLISILGKTHGERIDTLVHNVFYNSLDQDHVKMSFEILKALEDLRNFLFEKVYHHPLVDLEMEKAKKILFQLYEYLEKHIDYVYLNMESLHYGFDQNNPKQTLVDFISLMTDNEALNLFYQIYIPKKTYLISP